MRNSELMVRAQKNLSYELFDAGRDGNLNAAREALERGLEEGARIDGRDKDGRTPLQAACLHGHIDVARLLLENGASPVAKDKDGLTTLEYIAGLECGYDRDKILEALVECYPEYADKMPKTTGEETQAAVTQLQGG